MNRRSHQHLVSTNNQQKMTLKEVKVLFHLMLLDCRKSAGVFLIPRLLVRTRCRGRLVCGSNGMLQAVETPSTWRKTCPSGNLSTTNLTWTDLRSKQGFSCDRPATNRLSYGAAINLPFIYTVSEQEFSFSLTENEVSDT